MDDTKTRRKFDEIIETFTSMTSRIINPDVKVSPVIDAGYGVLFTHEDTRLGEFYLNVSRLSSLSKFDRLDEMTDIILDVKRNFETFQFST